MSGVDLPRLKREWRGRHVRTKVDLRNGWGVIPAGTVMVVDENRRTSTRTPGSLALSTTQRCECCRLLASISGVRVAVRSALLDVVEKHGGRVVGS